MGKDGAPSQAKFMLLQAHMFAHLFSGNIHSPTFVQQVSFLVHTRHYSRYRSEHNRSHLCIHGAFLQNGRTERDMYTCTNIGCQWCQVLQGALKQGRGKGNIGGGKILLFIVGG